MKLLAAFAECVYILNSEYCREVRSAYMRCTAKRRGNGPLLGPTDLALKEHNKDEYCRIAVLRKI